MSTEYIKTSWQDGDIITADKMNNIENGIKDVDDTIGELKENLNELDSQINGIPVLTPTEIPVSTFSTVSWNIWKSSGRWRSQNNSGYVMELPSGIEKIVISGNPSYETLYAFLSSYNPVADELAPILGGTSVPSIITSGGESEMVPPQGATYLWIQRIDPNGHRVDPSSVVFYTYVSQTNTIVGEIASLQDDVSGLETSKVDKIVGKGLSTNDYTDADKTKIVRIDTLDEQINGGTILVPVDKALSDFVLQNWMILPNTGKWASQTNRGYFVELEQCKKVSLVGNANRQTEVAFLSNYSPVADAVAPIVGNTLPTKVAVGQVYEANVPEGATYFYIRRLDGDGYNIEPSQIKFYYSQSGGGLVAEVDALKSDLSELSESVDEKIDSVFTLLPYVYTLENKLITAAGVITANNSSLLSEVFHVAKGSAITSDGSYKFRFIIYSDETGETIQSVSDWYTGAYTFSSDRYIRFHARYAINENLRISPESITPHIVDTCGIPKTYLKSASVSELDGYEKINLMSMNEVLPNAEDMLWTWWNYPQVQSFSRSRDKLYWVYTSSDGYAGVATYDYKTKTVIKNHLKWAATDDHNAPAVYIQPDGHIIASYAGGHETDNYIHIRHSSARENIEHFDEEIRLESYANTTYSQIHEYNGVLYIFYRRNSKDWMVVKSTDGGYTWTNEEIVVHANSQYYVLFKPTTVNGVLRMVMYSNPVVGAPEIRQGFLHLDTWGIYNSDNSTYLGTGDIDYTNFTVLIGLEDANVKPYQRFLDTAVSAPNVTRILYCQFSDDESGDAIYQMYDSGNTITICPAGLPFWVPKYQCGASFIDSSRIVVIYNANGKDYVTIWEYSNGTVQKTKTIYEETVGNTPIRNARPIVDINGKALLWHRGFYNPDRFTDFDTDAKIYDIINDEILI